jgi:hypothetical protein
MSFGRALDKFAEGFTKGVEAADRHAYNRAATERIRKPTESEVETETTPLEDGGGGTVTTSPSTSGGTTKTNGTKTNGTKSTPAPAKPTDTETVTKDDGTITSKGGSTDTLLGSRGSDTLSGGATGSNFGRNVYNYYVSKGLSPAAAAGFAGNFMQESGGASDVIAGTRKGDQGRSGYIGQWQGKRQNNLHAFAKNRGHDTPSLKDQLDFALEEGNPKSPYRDDVWASKSHLLNSVKSPEEATALIRQFFERPSAQDLGKRTRYALQAAGGKGGSFTDIAGSQGGGGGDTLVDSGPVAGTRPDAGVIPDFMSGDTSGDNGDGGSRSANLMIQAPEINTATPGYAGLPELDTDWAKSLGFAEGGAIPDDNKFGWGAILNQGNVQGNVLASTGNTGGATNTGSPGGALGNLWDAGAGMMGMGGFNKPANYGAGAPSVAAGYSRDAADAASYARAASAAAPTQYNQQMATYNAKAARAQPAHWQPNAPAPTQYQQQMAAYNAQVAAQAKQAAAAAAARQAEITATAKKKAAMDKAIKDAAAKNKAAIAAAVKKQNAKVKAPVVLADTALSADKAPDVKAIGGGSGGMSPAEVAWAIKKATWPTTHGGQELSDLDSPAATRIISKAASGQTLTPAELRAIDIMQHHQPSRMSSRYEGGIIPDPADPTSFARGGKVKEPSSVDPDGYFTRRAATATNRDERFKQLLAEEERGGGRGGASGNARDRAARRLSVEEGRAPSTAYRPGGGGARREGAPARSGETRPKLPAKTDVVPTPRPDTVNDIVPVAAGTPLGGYEPAPTPVAAGTPLGGYEPAPTPVAAGTPTQGYDTPAIPEPDTGDTTAATPPVQATGPGQGQVVPPVTGGGVDRTQDAIDAQRRREQAQRDRVDASVRQKEALRTKFPNAKWPPSPTPPRAAGTPTGGYQDTPDFGAILNAARSQLASGRDPQEIANTLNGLSVPPEMWPAGIPKPITPPVENSPYNPDDLNKFLGFEKGGAIPDPESGGGSFFSGISNEAAAEGRTEKLQPTPKLMGHVAEAAHGGLQFLKQTFGMGGDGAIATPDDAAMRQSGARRMASGEGAATPDEIARTDQAIDPGGQLATHDKTMLRMAKTYQWYLEQGRKDEADAVAASLLQFGAQRTQHLGSLAAAAYSKYQQSGDPKDLDAAAGAIEEAYKYIPNGGNADISIGANGSLQVQHTDADGNVENVDIAPNEIPGLLKSAMDGSYYWGEIAKVADPKGYESRLTSERQAADDARARREWDRQHDITSEEEKADEERTAKRQQEEWDRQHGITQKEELKKEKRTAEAELEKEKRTNLEEERRKLRDVALEEAKTAAKGAEPKSDAAALPGALGEASRAQIAYDADKTPENKQALDASLAKLLKAYGFDAGKVEAAGFTLQGADLGAEAAPYPGWTLNTSAKDGQKYWVSPDGKQKTLAAGG